MRTKWLPKIDRARCTGCGICVTACPQQALALVHQTASLIQATACTYCRTCEDICPASAIDLPFLICFAPPTTQRNNKLGVFLKKSGGFLNE